MNSNKEDGCGTVVSLPICVNCEKEDLSVKRGLCGYCIVVHPHLMDTIKCEECQEFKKTKAFHIIDGELDRRQCIECEIGWEKAMEPAFNAIKAERERLELVH